MRRTETAFLVAIAGFLAGFCLLGLLHYGYSWSLMRFPLLAAGVTLSLVLARLALHAAAVPAGAAAHGRPRSQVSPAATVLRLLSVVPLVFVLGYPAGLALYLLWLVRRAGERWSTALGIAAGSLVLSYGLFVEVLAVPLPVAPPWWAATAGSTLIR